MYLTQGSQAVSLGMWMFSDSVSMSERKSSISSLPIFIVPSEKVLPWGAMSERTGSISPFPSSYALQKNLTLGS